MEHKPGWCPGLALFRPPKGFGIREEWGNWGCIDAKSGHPQPIPQLAIHSASVCQLERFECETSIVALFFDSLGCGASSIDDGDCLLIICIVIFTSFYNFHDTSNFLLALLRVTKI